MYLGINLPVGGILMDAHAFVKKRIDFRTGMAVMCGDFSAHESRYYERHSGNCCREWSLAQCGLRFFQFSLHSQRLKYVDGLAQLFLRLFLVC